MKMSADPTYGINNTEPPPRMTETEKFYKSVIEKVMENSKNHFLNNGISEKVHDKLKKTWLKKLNDAEVYGRDINRRNQLAKSIKASYSSKFNTDTTLQSNQVNDSQAFQNLPQGAIYPGGSLSQIKSNYIATAMNPTFNHSAFAAFQAPTMGPGGVPPHGGGSAFTPGKIPNLNLNLNMSKGNKPKSEGSIGENRSNKRMPTKKDISRMNINYKFKNDGQNDDDEGEDDDDDEEDDDEEEEDPDLALFQNNKLTKKQSSRMSPKPQGSGDVDNQKKDSNQSPFEFPKKYSGVSSPGSKKETNSMKMRSMEEVKKSLDDPKPGIKFDSFSIPGKGATDSEENQDANSSLPLTQENLAKFGGSDGTGLKRAKKERRDSGENLDEVSLSEEDIETQDTLIGQYIKVNRTKQKYRWEFVDVILHVSGTDYLLKKIHAEITG